MSKRKAADPKAGGGKAASKQNSENSAALQAALEYANRGWAVLPLWRPEPGPDGNLVCACRRRGACGSSGKHPRHPKGVHGASKEPKRVERWKWSTANVGIATGRPSGLIVLDIDPRNGGDKTLKELEKQLGKLPAGPMVRTGGGGWHLYFQLSGDLDGIGCPVVGDGVEAKGTGGYVVAPPSKHFSGGQYAWQIHPDEVELPELPEAWRDCLAKRPVTDDMDDMEDMEDTDDAKDVRGEGVSGFSPNDFQEEIAATLPNGPGLRHRKVFELARTLKARCKTSPWRYREVVRAWYRRLEEKAAAGGWEIRASEDENWIDFVEGYYEVKWEKGAGPVLDCVIARAKQQDVPRAARHYDAAIQLLVKVCREFQRLNYPEPFFLATSVAAKILGSNRMHAHRVLNILCEADEGILQRVHPGDAGRRKAAVFRYIAESEPGKPAAGEQTPSGA